MRPDFPNSIEDRRSIDEGLAERSESEGKVGGLPECRAAKTTPFHASASRASTRMLSNLGVLALSFVPATEDAVSNKKMPLTSMRKWLLCSISRTSHRIDSG
jgi:hypothetical protein